VPNSSTQTMLVHIQVLLWSTGPLACSLEMDGEVIGAEDSKLHKWRREVSLPSMHVYQNQQGSDSICTAGKWK
jgi:hypothetical protein